MSFGQNVKILRNKYGLSLVELADLSGISFSMLSKIEREEKNPTLNVAVRIARALKTSLSDLVEERKEQNVIIVRRAERKFELVSESGAKGEPISSFFPRGNIEIIAVELPGGASTDPIPPHDKGVKEYLFVQTGSVKLLINSDEYQVDEGDYIYYEPSSVHRISNLASGPSSVLMIIDRSVQAVK